MSSAAAAGALAPACSEPVPMCTEYGGVSHLFTMRKTCFVNLSASFRNSVSERNGLVKLCFLLARGYRHETEFRVPVRYEMEFRNEAKKTMIFALRIVAFCMRR